MIDETNSIDGALITYYNAVTLLDPIINYTVHRIYNVQHGLQMFISRTCFQLIINDVVGHPNYDVDKVANNLAIVTVSSWIKNSRLYFRMIWILSHGRK